MLMTSLERDKKQAEEKIIEVQQSTVFSSEYKATQIPLQEACIANIVVEIAAVKRIMSQTS